MSSSRAAATAIVFGVLALLAIPAGALAAQFLNSVTLLQGTEASVPCAFVVGLIAVAAARRARYGVERSVRRTGERVVRVGRFFAWAGLYIATSGALALGFYGLLVWRGG